MSKFKTTQEEQAELLKYLLLSKAQQAKNFYKTSMFQPQTVLNVALSTQRAFYDKVDEIGSRIASDEYGRKTPARRSYMDTTAKMAEQLTKELDRQFRAGELSPQSYNDIIGYMSSTWGVALTEKNKEFQEEIEQAKKQDPKNIENYEKLESVAQRQALRMDPIGRLALTQLGKNYTNLSVPQLLNLGSELGQASKEKMREWFIQTEEQRKKIEGASGPYIQEVQGRSNISMPIPQIGQGEQTNQLVGKFTQGLVGPGSASDPRAGGIGGQMVTQDPNQIINTKSNNMISNSYGLPPAVSQMFDNQVMKLLSDGHRAKQSPPVFRQAITSLAFQYKAKYPNFESEQAVNNITAKYEEQRTGGNSTQAKIENNTNTAGAIQGEIMNKLMIDDANTNLNAKNVTKDPGSHTQQTQKASIQRPENNVKPVEHFKSALSKTEATTKSIINDIINHDQPGGMEGGADVVKNDLMDVLTDINFKGLNEGIVFNLQKDVDEIPETSELNELKNTFTPEEIGEVMNRLNQYDDKDPETGRPYYETWPVFEQEIEGYDEDDDEYDDAVRRGKAQVESFYRAYHTALGEVKENYTKLFNKYPLVKVLKQELDKTTMNPNDVYLYYLSVERRRIQGKGKQGKGKNNFSAIHKYPSRYTEKRYIPDAEGAQTAMVKDPPMRFTVGGDFDSGIYVTAGKKKPVKHNIVVS